jgi:hypothetical protein
MDEFERGSVVQWFELLEDRLLDFIRIVPLCTENLTVHSPHLAGIILEAGGLLDSVLREIAPEPEDPKSEEWRGNLDMADYEGLYRDRFGLPELRSYILVSPPQVRCPFAVWGQGEHLTWWAMYNRIKHNRIRHLREATLDVAVDAMCALHQILARAPNVSEAVLRRHWFKSKASSPSHALGMLEGDSRWKSFSFLVGSKLFLIGRGGGGGLPVRIKDFDLQAYWPDDGVLDFFADLTN